MFYKLTVTSAQSIKEKYPDAIMKCDYRDYKFSLAYGEIKSCFRPLTKYASSQYLTQNDFRSEINIFNFYVFRYVIKTNIVLNNL